MDPSTLYPSLLRPTLLHILRAAGFTTTRPSVLDTLVDLTSRHLLLLATHTHRHALLRQRLGAIPYPTITLPDVRMAMQDVGSFYPSMGEMEEEARGEEDLRGVEAFVGWCLGEGNREIRRVAGMETPVSVTALQPDGIQTLNGAKAPEKNMTGELDDSNQDFLTQLKRKHAKTRDGEEARYAGTVLGRDREATEVKIEGWGEVESIAEWKRRLQANGQTKDPAEVQEMELEEGEDEDGSQKEAKSQRRSTSSSPLSEISGEVGD